MSQIVTRKGAVGDDKEKRTESPVKDMKKKVAANAEKEKLADKPGDKSTDKIAEKPTDKKDKSLDKSFEKKSEKKDSKSVEKPVEQKAEKPVEKKAEKPVEKKAEKPVEKKAEQKDEVHKPKDDGKGEKTDKADKSEEKKTQSPKPKQNSQETQHNGTVQSNGNKENGTVSSDEEDQNDMLVIEEQDEMFPELAYDDGSDVECFEPPTPENVPSRSLTRRSQAKLTRTPETPRPASVKQDTQPTDDSKEPKDSKVLKLKEDAHASDRKLRSADSPKPQEKKDEEKGDGKSPEKAEKIEVDVVIDVDAIEDGERRKTDTNFSKSRVKVSPYRRSVRLDNTISSIAANYTGNNTTMEMDITESSSFTEDVSLDDSSYLSGLRQIRGRRSYKPLKEMQMRRLVNRSMPSGSSVTLSEQGRPTVTVVGRKRKPDADAAPAPALQAGKRARIFERIALPFRRAAPAAPEIVGVNTDLPLTTAVASTETFDPETIKQSIPLIPASTPVLERERKCIIM